MHHSSMVHLDAIACQWAADAEGAKKSEERGLTLIETLSRQICCIPGQANGGKVKVLLSKVAGVQKQLLLFFSYVLQSWIILCKYL